MQEVFSKKINLSPKAQSIYERLAQLNQIQNLGKTEEHQGGLLVNYTKLALEFKCSIQQLRRYLISLEKAGLLERRYVASNASMYIQFLSEETKENQNKKGAAR